MSGSIGIIIAKADEQDKLIKILLEGTTDITRCPSYIISKGVEDEDAI